MITLNPLVSSLLREPHIETFYLITIGDYRTTDYPYSLVVDGLTFESDGKLVDVDSPRISTTVDRAVFKVSFADPSIAFASFIDEGIVGLPFEVRMGFVQNNVPLSSLSDTILAYKGRVDQGAYANNMGDLGEVILELSGASPVASLDMVRTFHSTKDYIKKLNVNDSSFDQLYEGSGAVTLRWGKG